MIKGMIAATALVKTFDGFPALDGLTLTAPRGTVYGLVGPNGAGKSTLIRILAGVYRPDSGAAVIDGAPIYDNPAVKRHLFCIFDDIFYYAQASTRDMMRLCRELYPSFDADRYEKLREAFPSVQERAPLRQLSKGQLKQSAFWLAMACRPDVLLLDEPVDGLDPVARRQVWSILLGDVAEHGTTVLLSSHNLRELEDVCDHVGVMNRGQMLCEESLSDLQTSVTKLQILFDGDPPPFPEGLELLHTAAAGKLQTIIVRGSAEQALQRLSALAPLYLEALPLTLEEIFIYELGGASYAVKDILV